MNEPHPVAIAQLLSSSRLFILNFQANPTPRRESICRASVSFILIILIISLSLQHLHYNTSLQHFTTTLHYNTSLNTSTSTIIFIHLFNPTLNQPQTWSHSLTSLPLLLWPLPSQLVLSLSPPRQPAHSCTTSAWLEMSGREVIHLLQSSHPFTNRYR